MSVSDVDWSDHGKETTKRYSLSLLIDLCLYRQVSALTSHILPYGIRDIIKQYTYTSITSENIRTAVCRWFKDPEKAAVVYGHISTWDTSKVLSMRGLFRFRKFWNDARDDISAWDVSNVIDMKGLFFCSKGFNHPLQLWNVDKVQYMQDMFSSTDSFNQPIGNWNVSNVTNMSNMFYGASAFNQPIGRWNVSRVTDMRCMFEGTSSFNQPLDSWELTKSTKATAMFYNAFAFHQSVETWPRFLTPERRLALVFEELCSDEEDDTTRSLQVPGV